MIFKNILERIGLDKTSTEELLGEVLKSNTCLLLLDGLDEWQHPDECTLDEIIPHTETRWENCTILITTRPYKLAELRISRSQIGKHVMLKGVSNPKRLVEKVVSSLNEVYDIGRSQDPKSSRLPMNSKICINEIRENKLWHFSESPIVLVHIVWLWYKEKLSKHMKLSDPYGTLLKERWFESCGKRKSASGSKYNEMISTLSEVAFEKLFAKYEHSTLVFEIDEEKNTKFESQKSASLESGILSCSNVPGDSPLYHFLHKTVQEYLAALYLSKDFEKCCLHIKQTYKNHRRESGKSLSNILLFLCGLSSKAAEELAKIINELFSDFCDIHGYSELESRKIQDMIIEGQTELDRSDNSGTKLCLQHICIDDYNRTVNEDYAAALEQYKMSNESCIVSLRICRDKNKPAYNEILDLENYKCLKYLDAKSFHDLSGLNLSNLVECRIHLKSDQKASNLIATFYKSDINCLKKIKHLQLTNWADLNWLHERSEREETLDIRRLANLEHLTVLGLEGLPYSDVENLQELRLHSLRVGFKELQQAPQLMSTLLAHGTCQTERDGVFSHLKHIHLSNISMSEEQFGRLLQSYINAGRTSLVLLDCDIEPIEDSLQLQTQSEQEVSSDCTTEILLFNTTITVEGFIRLIDNVTRCGHYVECHLKFTTLTSYDNFEQFISPMVVTQPFLEDYTTELSLFDIDMSTEQMCQIVARMNQLNHSVTLTLIRCAEEQNEYNPMGIQMLSQANPSQDCTKHIKIIHMDISETLFWYTVTSAFHFGYMCYTSQCDILTSEKQTADNLYFPQMAAIHPPAHTTKLIFENITMSHIVIEHLACQASVSGHFVECVLNKCNVWPHSDCWSLKEKMGRDPAIQIEKFELETQNFERRWRVNPSKEGQICDIRFKANANNSASTAEKPEVMECTRM